MEQSFDPGMQSVAKRNPAFIGMFGPEHNGVFQVDILNIATPIAVGMRLVHPLWDKRTVASSGRCGYMPKKIDLIMVAV
jgi:hypothetical protein